MGLYIKQNGAIKPLAGSTPGEGLPVGAITAFTANSIPSGWLLCDGSTFDDTVYPALAIVLGGNVLPDLRNRFLEGADSVVREFKEAGLPNVTGRIAVGGAYPFQSANNAFSLQGSGNFIVDGVTQSYNQANAVVLDAKNGETKADGTVKTADEYHVYGSSDTVQPASYTVNYIIKATSGIATEAALDAFNMIKEYERKQNSLSDIETITTTASTDNIAEYDGYLVINVQRLNTDSGSAKSITINGITVYSYATGVSGANTGDITTFPIKKGDVWSIGNVSSVKIYGRWYKERDYEGR